MAIFKVTLLTAFIDYGNQIIIIFRSSQQPQPKAQPQFRVTKKPTQEPPEPKKEQKKEKPNFEVKLRKSEKSQESASKPQPSKIELPQLKKAQAESKPMPVKQKVEKPSLRKVEKPKPAIAKVSVHTPSYCNKYMDLQEPKIYFFNTSSFSIFKK